jgi:ribonuclease HI
MEEAEISLEKVSDDALLTDQSPWTLPEVEIRLDLTRFKKAVTNQVFYKEAYIELCLEYERFERIFTDGSKSDCATASAAVAASNLDKPFKRRLLDDSSVFTAELNAILLALKHVYQSKKKRFLILSDSLSALQAIAAKRFRNHLVTDFYDVYATLAREGKIVVLAWIPSHMGIRGNIIVDAAAKSALDDEIEPFRLPFESVPWIDLRRKTSEYVHRQWQIAWSKLTENKLFNVCPDLKKPISLCRRNRREESILARLHIGHSYVTHSYRFTRDPPPECYACAELYSIKHILIDCADLIDIRKKHYNVDSLKTLFTDVAPANIFNFLKESNLFYKL